MAWETSSFVNLNVLRLFEVPTGPSATATLRLMRASPHLRIFSPGRTLLAPGLEPACDVQGSISLAYLEEMEIYGYPREVTYVLDRITVPSTCSISIHYIWNQSPEDLRLMQSLFPRQLAFRNLLPHCTALTLALAAHLATIAATCCCSGHCPILIRVSGASSIGSRVIAEDTWTSLLHACAGSPLTRIDVAYYPGARLSSSMWTALLEHFPLQVVQASIHLCREDQLLHLHHLFSALRTPCARPVRVLELCGPVLDAALADALLDLHEHRAASDMPLDELVFMQCYFEPPWEPEEFMARLALYVKPVIK